MVALDEARIQERKIELLMQLRRQGIIDARVLSAIERVPREKFVTGPFEDQAYENNALPIECGQTISQPYVVAFMTIALDVGPRSKVLEIGTGSGYQAAVLSHLCRRVYTIERYRTLLREAEVRFRNLDLHNVTTKSGDGSKGWPEQAPFDRIIVTAAAEHLPIELIDQLKIDGSMIIPIGRSTADQKLYRVRRTENGAELEELLPVRFVPLIEGMPKDA